MIVGCKSDVVRSNKRWLESSLRGAVLWCSEELDHEMMKEGRVRWNCRSRSERRRKWVLLRGSSDRRRKMVLLETRPIAVRNSSPKEWGASASARAPAGSKLRWSRGGAHEVMSSITRRRVRFASHCVESLSAYFGTYTTVLQARS